MKKIIILLLSVMIAWAGRTSQWSSTFMLKEPINTILNGKNSDGLHNRFDLTVRQGPLNSSALFYLSGLAPENHPTLRIYTVDGRQVADLSEFLGADRQSVAWKTQRIPAGIFFAKLQSGGHLKIVKFVLCR